ncbi:YybH family protein [Janthinobacterium agaricidamnosum]|uniref:DUF4440 domain-containing protein n=1 Tax=Janthinobacterium agaricidamnosum NBRC 102515 = DSM 9628 TaxID=1349767 RepID=W0UZU0_9BURK|nr:nuclear transport factor 2 family protein [Janthinobacterium agaricidamnosum]CDG82089.1 hypothetical protein GJA_1438 [Janthinobacterium agaricidamnosum NBRC 102515 = DSM 9628]
MKTNKQARHWQLALVMAAALLAAPTLALAQTTIAGVTVQSGPSEAVQAWRQALEAGDSAAIARMHGPDTVVYGTNDTVTRGGKAIMAGYGAMFERYRPTVEIRDAAWVRQGALLNSWGQFTLTLTPRAGGEAVRIDGRFSDLAVWADGRWQYVMDHASVPVR